jgi:hypothetical protein
MNEKILAWTGLVMCALGLVRLLLGERQRQWIDDFVRLRFKRISGAWRWMRLRRQAVRETDEVIRRARRNISREGNVYKPEVFRRPKKPH